MESFLAIAPQLLINALIAGSIYALASSGLALSYGVSRILNFAHGQNMMLGAYLFLFVSSSLFGLDEGGDAAGHSIVLTAVIGLAAVSLAAMIGVGVFSVFIAPFSGRSALLPFVATVAAGKILENTVAILFGVNVRSISASVDSIDLGFGFITHSQILTIVSALIVLSALALFVNRSSFGRTIRAVQAYPAAATALGINARQVHRTVFMLSAALAAFAGILAGYETSLQPTMGGSYTVKALAVMVLGGLGNVWGTVIASYLLAALETIIVGVDFGSVSIPIGYRDGVAFVIILGMLLWRPQGLLGSRTARGAV